MTISSSVTFTTLNQISYYRIAKFQVFLLGLAQVAPSCHCTPVISKLAKTRAKTVINISRAMSCTLFYATDGNHARDGKRSKCRHNVTDYSVVSAPYSYFLLLVVIVMAGYRR